MMKILPTHHCFDDAMEFLEEMAGNHPDLLLVHGVLVSAKESRYTHAWVEVGESCYDAGLVDDEKMYFKWPADVFYKLRRVELVTKYTVDQVVEKNLEHGTWGPWEPLYLNMCTDSRAILGEVDVSHSR